MEKPEPKHQARFVPSGYLVFTKDMLFSFGSSQTWPIEGLNSSVELESWRMRGCSAAAQKGQAAQKEDVGYEREGISTGA